MKHIDKLYPHNKTITAWPGDMWHMVRLRINKKCIPNISDKQNGHSLKIHKNIRVIDIK